MKLPGDIVLFDLPTYPKGVISLSLPLVAACLQNDFNISIIDLNFNPHDYYKRIRFSTATVMFGVKVSAQNINEAQLLSTRLRAEHPGAKIVWGGELPSLLPDKCLEYADSIVKGLFDPIAKEFSHDLKNGLLKKIYDAGDLVPFDYAPPPLFAKLPNPERYYEF